MDAAERMLAETGGGVWSWVEVMGARWRRVELGEQFSITPIKQVMYRDVKFRIILRTKVSALFVKATLLCSTFIRSLETKF